MVSFGSWFLLVSVGVLDLIGECESFFLVAFVVLYSEVMPIVLVLRTVETEMKRKTTTTTFTNKQQSSTLNTTPGHRPS